MVKMVGTQWNMKKSKKHTTDTIKVLPVIEEIVTEEVVIKEPVLEKVAPTHDQLLKALYWMFDVMDRALINFYVVGETGECIRNKKDLTGTRVMVAVRKNDWESGARRIADAFAPNFVDNGETVDYEYEGVPVRLFVLPDSTTLTNHDTVIYNSEYFKLPNPYEQFKKEFIWLK